MTFASKSTQASKPRWPELPPNPEPAPPAPKKDILDVIDRWRGVFAPFLIGAYAVGTYWFVDKNRIDLETQIKGVEAAHAESLARLETQIKSVEASHAETLAELEIGSRLPPHVYVNDGLELEIVVNQEVVSSRNVHFDLQCDLRNTKENGIDVAFTMVDYFVGRLPARRGVLDYINSTSPSYSQSIAFVPKKEPPECCDNGDTGDEADGGLYRSCGSDEPWSSSCAGLGEQWLAGGVSCEAPRGAQLSVLNSVQWHHLGYVAYAMRGYEDKVRTALIKDPRWRGRYFDVNAGGTGPLRHGGHSPFEEDFLVRNEPETLVGFEVVVGYREIRRDGTKGPFAGLQDRRISFVGNANDQSSKKAAGLAGH